MCFLCVTFKTLVLSFCTIQQTIISLSKCLGLLEEIVNIQTTSALFIYGQQKTLLSKVRPEKWLHTITTSHFLKPQHCSSHQIPCFLIELDKTTEGYLTFA